MAGRRRLALLAMGLSAVVLVGDALLVRRAVAGAEAEARRQHQLVADRIFDELQRELDSLVDREEARSFLEYRYFFVPERQVYNAVGLARSPISEPARDSAVIGYFQVDPDGALYNPARPRDNELQLALDNDIYQASGDLDALDARLGALIADLSWDAPAAPAPAAVAVAEPPQQQQAYQQAVQQLNRAGRSVKQATRIQTTNSALANFTNEQNTAELLSQQEQQWDTPPAADLVPLHSVGDEQVDVVVSPIRGAAVSAGELVLYRTVRVGADTYRQGLALDVDRLTAHIAALVLADAGLEGRAEIAWTLGADPAAEDAGGGAYVFSSRFAAPFAALSATAHLAEIPGAGGGQRRILVGLSVVLALATVAGAAGLYRAVSAELEFAERRNNFVAAVSHELKTPLTAIRMYAEMLQEGIVPSEAKRQQYYETITAESERLSRLINNVLELSRLEKGNRSMAVTVGDVGPILEQAAAILRPHVTQHGLSLVVTVEPGLPPVKVDADALSQILVNLVDNAVKFARSGEVFIAASREGEAVRVVVRDTGPGVPARQLDKIFEPFYRGERELTRKTKGTGIGLALVSGLVSGMGGSVSARNHPGGGLEVSLRLAVG